jgi:dCMP deaminase
MLCDKTSDKWDIRFMDMAKLVASWSKDLSTKVGAVITDKNHRVISVGYNGFPKDISDKEEYIINREEKYPRTLHSEINAILFAQKDLSGMTLYCTHFPCAPCAAVIIQSNIKRLVTTKSKGGFGERWNVTNRIAVSMFREANVAITELEYSE